MIPTLEQTAYTLLLAAVLAAAIGIAWLMFLAGEREDERRRQTGDPQARTSTDGTGAERGNPPQVRPAPPRSPMAPAGTATNRSTSFKSCPPASNMLVDATGRQTAAPTSPHIRRVSIHG